MTWFDIHTEFSEFEKTDWWQSMFHVALTEPHFIFTESACWAWARLEPPSVQILVVVANTPARPWRTDVEKGFAWTVVARESVDPKLKERSYVDVLCLSDK